jgi:hypothetical protein
LNELFESAELEPAKPQRLLRSAQLQSQSVDQEYGTMEKSMTAETLVAYETETIDPLSFIDPVNVLDKIPKDFYDNLVCFSFFDNFAFCTHLMIASPKDFGQVERKKRGPGCITRCPRSAQV